MQLRFFSKYAPTAKDTRGVRLDEEKFASFLPRQFETKQVRVSQDILAESSTSGAQQGKAALPQRGEVKERHYEGGGEGRTPGTRFRDEVEQRQARCMLKGCRQHGRTNRVTDGWRNMILDVFLGLGLPCPSLRGDCPFFVPLALIYPCTWRVPPRNRMMAHFKRRVMLSRSLFLDKN